jgi:hypothetical protein
MIANGTVVGPPPGVGPQAVSRSTAAGFGAPDPRVRERHRAQRDHRHRDRDVADHRVRHHDDVGGGRSRLTLELRREQR